MNMIINQCPHTKLLQLDSGVQVSFFYNEWGNVFLGSLLFQGIPHYHTIKDPVLSKEEGFRLLEDSSFELAEKVLNEIMTWDNMKVFSKQDVIDWWNGKY